MRMVFPGLDVRRKQDIPRFVAVIAAIVIAESVATALMDQALIVLKIHSFSTVLLTKAAVALAVAVPLAWMVAKNAAATAEAGQDAVVALLRDDLTGLLNGAAFSHAMENVSDPVVLAFVQIDNFGELRCAGPRATNRAAARVSDTLKSLIGGDGTLYRTGPKRFAWIIPDGRTDFAFERLEKARAALSRHDFARSAGPSSLTISCGIAVGAEAEALQIAAERALAIAKSGGKNQIRIDYAHAGRMTSNGSRPAEGAVAGTFPRRARFRPGGGLCKPLWSRDQRGGGDDRRALNRSVDDDPWLASSALKPKQRPFPPVKPSCVSSPSNRRRRPSATSPRPSRSRARRGWP